MLRNDSKLTRVCQIGIISAAKTRTIQDNGFNPTFGEKGQGETFTFDIQVCVSVSVRADVYRCVSASMCLPCMFLSVSMCFCISMSLCISICLCVSVSTCFWLWLSSVPCGKRFVPFVQDRESAMLRVVVMDEDKTWDADFIGQYSVPVTCIRKVLSRISLHRVIVLFALV
jgi:hypothetical protein